MKISTICVKFILHVFIFVRVFFTNIYMQCTKNALDLFLLVFGCCLCDSQYNFEKKMADKFILQYSEKNSENIEHYTPDLNCTIQRLALHSNLQLKWL